ncbi:PQQ-dependent sugar dehydrogenase [Blastococcus sp. LR1]|uniref:PQQ-dependent sugar dehydrogenase n=1 Tax=Blastococcus sp. LR1 TaxID=2877000 RepID=UPI001CCB6E17|nr:PQQ-dependent sugar dehydrogenase [Blastococcus sp. LR1]MCA0144585.1 PQQ-dependent sugar dehydrogenase [Blastococcus sp. LR1]
MHQQGNETVGYGARRSRWGIGLLRTAVVAVLLAGLAVVVPGTAQAAPYLPAGFAVQTLPSGQDALLTDFDFAPDGSWFTTGKDGRVAWVSPSGQARTLANLPVVTVQDLGLSGVAVASDYETSRTIYLARTLMVNNQWTMRLSAHPVVQGTGGPVGLGAERVIWNLPIQSDVHTITGIVAASDGTLWVSMGDAADFRVVDPLALRALDINTGYGKVLHIHPDGRGVAANPYYDAANPSSWKSRVYASGFRSPFRLSLDPTTGTPVLGDVGWNTWEEVNLIRPGANYGWPCWEGNTRTPGYADLAACQGVGNTAPLWTYVHGPLGTSITGGIVYTGSSYPTTYRGSYFYGDYSSQRVYTLRYDAKGALVRQPEAGGFGVENGLPVDFEAHPENGDVMWADIGSSTIKRLVYGPGNRPPTAVASFTNDPVTRTVTFDGRDSTDLDGHALTYRWDFGDGTTATGSTPTKTYAAPGTTARTVKLTVTDSLGATGTTSFTVVPANAAPRLTLAAPPADRRFAVGETVAASVAATDAEDGNLASKVSWSVVQVHCSGGYCHDHPGTTTAGPTYSAPFVDHGDSTSLLITARVTDSAGMTARETFEVQPRTRMLTVGANAPSAVTVNGTARASSEVTVGAQVSVIAPVTAADGVATFDRWNDGQPRERSFRMGDADLTLTATYSTPIDRRYASDAAVRAVLGAPKGAEAGDAALRYREYTAGRMYWTPAVGAKEVHGTILATYLAQGGHVRLGVPTTDELRTPDGVGRYNNFSALGATIYWTQATGAKAVYGDIAAVWRKLGAEKSPHGYPKSDERPTPNGRGRFNDFQNGGIYWTTATGAHSVRGAIYDVWAKYRYEAGHLGFPLTDERGTPDKVGRYNHFEGGSVYWTSRTGAHEIRGAIKARWEALGWETSYLGYPTSDELVVANGRRTNFERGYIVWDARTGAVTDRRY